MGSPKALVPFRGSTFLEHLLAAVEANASCQIPEKNRLAARNRLDARGARRSRCKEITAQLRSIPQTSS